MVAPSDSNIIYTDSQNGSISRLDKATGMRKSIRPYVPGVSDMPPSKLEYRFNWTSPIAVSPHDANTVYIGANVLFRSTDGGDHWQTVSPDLTRNEKDKQIVPGGAVQYDISGAETYNTIISVTLAPTAPDSVIWVGTDDGLVQVTRDGGKTWTEVGHNMPGRPDIKGGRIYQIGVSPYDAGTAYVAVDYHMYDDNHPYVYRTSDYGKSWTAISKGLPAFGAAHVVRESPNKKGFLVLGTDNAIYYSRDDGATWNSFHSNFPTAPVWDVQFVKRDNDLLVATHGRGLFVLDDLTPLQDFDASASDGFQLFPVAPAAFQAGRSLRHPDASRYDVSGPPRGAVIDYYLPKSAPKKAGGGAHAGAMGGRGGRRGGPAAGNGAGQVQVAVLDAAGDTIATDKGPGHEGFNRFEWNLHYDGPTSLELGGGGGFGGRRFNSGPPVVPGTYTIAVTANGTTKKQSVKVEPDPHHPADMADFRAQTQAGLELTNRISALNENAEPDPVPPGPDRVGQEGAEVGGSLHGSGRQAGPRQGRLPGPRAGRPQGQSVQLAGPGARGRGRHPLPEPVPGPTERPALPGGVRVRVAPEPGRGGPHEGAGRRAQRLPGPVQRPAEHRRLRLQPGGRQRRRPDPGRGRAHPRQGGEAAVRLL